MGLLVEVARALSDLGSGVIQSVRYSVSGTDPGGYKVKSTATVTKKVLAAGLTLAVGIVMAPMTEFLQRSQAEAASWPAVIDRTSNHVTADSLPTVQIDGVAFSQAIVGDDVFVAGQFSNARPAGAAPGTNLTTRKNMLSYNITNGQLNAGFAPSLNSQVSKVVVSPDKTRAYAAGGFTTANGEPRYRLAAYDIGTGALIPGFAPVLNSTVTTLAVTNDTVYAAGWFSVANGQNRQRLAAFSASSGALLGWAPTAQDDVTSMVLSPDGSQIVVGGKFKTLNNSPAFGMGALDAVTGDLLPWQANTVIRNADAQAGISSLTVDDDTIYGTNFNYGTGNYEGVFAVNPEGGSIKWLADCHGDTLDAFQMNDVVYSVGHAHDCSNIYGFPDANPRGNYAAMSFTKEATGLVRRNQQSGSGYGDFEGQPAPSIYYWFPKMQPGTVTISRQAGWTIIGNGEYLSIGGEFPSVNRKNQQGLVRFAVPPKAPKKEGPLHQGYFFNPTVIALGSAGARVSWQANEDRDDQSLTYWVVRSDKPTAPIYTKTQVAPFWDRGTMQYLDTTVLPGSTYRYRVFVKDGDGNQTNSDYVSVTIPEGAALSDYPLQVLQDGAQHYWRLDESSGSTFADYVSGNDLTKQTGVSSSSESALANDSNRSASFNGQSSDGSASTVSAQPGPNEFSLETWFRTDTSSGGKIMGFGQSRTGASSSYDRHLYMDNDGRITFGVYPGGVRTIRSTDTYRDNQWHHTVATLSSEGMKLYVDGEMVSDDPSTTYGQTYDGYWRLGGDNLNGWPNTGSSSYFRGLIDETAVYSTALTPAQVSAHYVLATGRVPNEPPVADFVSASTGLSIVFDGSGSADPDGSIVSYVWEFGDGEIGSGAVVEHTYASEGSYDVSLTVTDDDGESHVVTKTVMAQVANQGPVAAFTWEADGLGVSFDGSGSADPDGSVASYVWEFGDGETGTGVSPAHTFASGGTYAVQLTVTDDDGEPDVVSQNITVVAANQAPIADFAATADGLDLALDAGASSDPDGSIVSYAWDFGDGATGTGATASHAYAKAGSYSVTLTVTDESSATNAVTKSFSVSAEGQPPTAAFTSTLDGLSVAFDGSGSADPDSTISSFAWDFGDGATGIGATTEHAYAAAGDYDVSLTVASADGGTASVIQTVTVSVTASGLANDAFERTGSGWGSADAGGVWTPTNAAALSTDGSTGRMRLSQAGMLAAAGLDNAVTEDLNMVVDVATDKVLTGNGAYVTLEARRVGNSSYRLKARLMADGVTHLALSRVVNGAQTTLHEVNVPSAVYAANETLRVRFVVSGNGTTTLQGTIWKKGSTEPSPQMNRTDTTGSLQGPGAIGVTGYLAGNATNSPVTLSFDNLAAWASATEPGSAENEPPVADFVSASTGLSIVFDGSGSADPDGSIVSYVWEFGDGEIGSGAVVEHTYASEGSYAVQLTVTDDDGEPDVVSQNITVVAANQAPIADFAATADGLDLALDAGASSDPDGSIVSYAWDFGDGATGTGATASHAYAKAGSYSVTLTVTDESSATNAVTKSFSVSAEGQPPTAAFTSTLDGLSVAFDGSGSADPDSTISSFAWDFGDGATGIGATTEHAYAAAGDYDVSLTVASADGGTASVIQTVTVSVTASGLANDAFERTGSGWGSADAGGVWTPTNAAALSTDGSTGRMRLSQAGMLAAAGLDNAVTEDLNMVVDVATDKVLTGNGAYVTLEARRVGNSSYRLKARLMADGVTHLALSRVVNGAQTTLHEVNVPSAVYAANETLRVRFVVSGNGTTTLQGTIWKKGSTEPSPQMNRTDTTGSLQGPGAIGVTGYLAGNATNSPVTLSFDNLAAWASATEPGQA